jgi:hypothetical protein
MLENLKETFFLNFYSCVYLFFSYLFTEASFLTYIGVNNNFYCSDFHRMCFHRFRLHIVSSTFI